MKQTQLTNHEIALFASQIELILHSGISPYEGIMIMNEDSEDIKTKEILSTIDKELSVGKSFYEALCTPQVFPEYMLNMVRIGETSGRLEEVMHSLSAHYQRLYENSENIKSAISYPFIMIIMMFIVIIVLMTQVLPIFNQVFEQLGSSMSGFSQMILSLGMTLSRYTYLLFALLIILLFIAIYFIKNPKGQTKLYHFLTKWRFTKDISLKMALSQFTSGMSIALSSGLDIDQSLQMAKQLVKHPQLKQRIEQTENMLSEHDLATAFIKNKVLTGMYARLLKIGNKTGHIDTIMQEIAIQYNQETDERIHHLISIIEPTLVAILSIFVGIILLSVMLPLIGIMASL